MGPDCPEDGPRSEETRWEGDADKGGLRGAGGPGTGAPNACPSSFPGILPQALTVLYALTSVWGVTGATVVTPLLSHTNVSPACTCT